MLNWGNYSNQSEDRFSFSNTLLIMIDNTSMHLSKKIIKSASLHDITISLYTLQQNPYISSFVSLKCTKMKTILIIWMWIKYRQ